MSLIRPLLRMLGMDLLFTPEIEGRTWSLMGWPGPSCDGQERKHLDGRVSSASVESRQEQ